MTWEVALVRKAPKDGAIVARVLGGTRLVVTGRQGDWYRVKYDAQGNEGFVFKSAIGL
ncbi:MAG: SH3 domain-containing protein [Polyangiaceae bacterium]